MKRASSESSGLQPTGVQVLSLPAPDAMEFEMSPGRICLVTDDGSDLSTELIRQLRHEALSVVALRFPDPWISHDSSRPSDGVSAETLRDIGPDAVHDALRDVARQYGPVGAFIYIHPLTADNVRLEGPLSSGDQALIRVPFLVAKELQSSLTDAAASGRACFVTVTGLDGMLGLSGCTETDPLAGGIAGLTKTLRLEWPDVFCRAIDLAPGMDAALGAEKVLAELQDPNRLVAEVAYGDMGRITLGAGPDSGSGAW